LVAVAPELHLLERIVLGERDPAHLGRGPHDPFLLVRGACHITDRGGGHEGETEDDDLVLMHGKPPGRSPTRTPPTSQGTLTARPGSYIKMAWPGPNPSRL